MNPYEGLNLPQLLDLMHDIVRPEPVSMWPQTQGWTILMVWLLMSALVIAWHGYRKWRANAYRREAAKRLAEISAHSRDPAYPAGLQLATLLKRTALAVYPRDRVAALHGDAWAKFLRQTSGDDPMVANAADQLASAAYHLDVDVSGLILPAARWIKIHRA